MWISSSHGPFKIKFGSVVVACLLYMCGSAWAYVYPVHLDQKPKGTAIELTLVNDGPAFINVIVELQSTSNTGFSPAVLGRKYPHLLKPGESKLIALAVPLKVGKSAQFSYKLLYAFGDPDARVKTTFPYRLPFAEGNRGVIRPYSGAYISNYLLDSGNAVEFLLPLNTPIVAARDGLVINARGIKGLSDADTPTSIGNFVSIMHDDGSWATYGWLADNSIEVKPGDRVKAGQPIALSGSNPDAYEDYIFFAVNKNFWALQLKSVPVKFTMYNGEVFDVLSYAGPVSPDLSPKYKVSAKNEAAWLPPESLVPTPKLPKDWNDEHLTSTQRAVVFRQRMAEAAEIAGTDSVSGSQPLLFLALTAALFGIVGAIGVLASHSTNKPSGVRGYLWGLLRGKAPLGPYLQPEVGAIPGIAPNQTALNEAFVRPSLVEPKKVEPALEAPIQEEHKSAATLLDEQRLKLLVLINKAMPRGYFCTAQVPLDKMITSGLPAALREVLLDFVLMKSTSGVPSVAVLLTDGTQDAISGPVAHRLSEVDVQLLSFHQLPSQAELKARLKRCFA